MSRLGLARLAGSLGECLRCSICLPSRLDKTRFRKRDKVACPPPSSRCLSNTVVCLPTSIARSPAVNRILFRHKHCSTSGHSRSFLDNLPSIIHHGPDSISTCSRPIPAGHRSWAFENRNNILWRRLLIPPRWPLLPWRHPNAQLSRITY